MLRTRIKRRAAKADHAVVRLAAVQASVTALGDEDLLDLADIFSGDGRGPLGEMASAEVLIRNLSL
ncbi:hypothetical protein [Sphingomonas sp. Leaf38]|uniref:hypothetical protein n=1 Tax=Sphingomonas sp. Leaf38 TaxID=1736217 RepID=UPI0006F63AB8|nr:hypothetical protein [Sphingomonas sp. Leaf38]KQN35387.1 hypothetical protein ASE88_17575 [Sphingomonas sp. Leaf38]